MASGAASTSEADDGGSALSSSAAPSSGPDGGAGCGPARGTTAKAKRLLEAAGHGDLQQVIALLEASGAGVNALRVRGCTALHEAAKGGHLPVVTDLLRRSAEVNAVNRSGCTPLHFAVLCKDKHRALEVAEFLLDTSAAINATAERMDTPLHFAAYCPPSPGCEEVLRCLISRRATVNMRNRKSESALMNASLHDNSEAVRVLLEHGADAGQQNSLSKTARDLALEQGCAAVLQVLEQQADPISQLKDISHQMRTALSQMQSVELMRSELQGQSAMAGAYEAVAQSVVSELDQESRAQLAEGALQDLRALDPGRALPGASGASGPGDPGRLLQALVTLLLVARSAGGPAALLGAGLLEALPQLELLVARDRVGQGQLRELRAALGGRQAELLEVSVRDRSVSSTPSSLDPQLVGASAPSPLSLPRCQSSLSTASSVTSRTAASLGAGQRFHVRPKLDEDAAEADSDASAPLGEPEAGARGLQQRHGLSFQSGRPHRLHWTSTPCTVGKKNIPLFTDERLIVSEEQPGEGGVEPSPVGTEEVSLPSSHGDVRRLQKPKASPQASVDSAPLSSVLPRDFDGQNPAAEAWSGDAVGKDSIKRRCCTQRGRRTCVLN